MLSSLIWLAVIYAVEANLGSGLSEDCRSVDPQLDIVIKNAQSKCDEGDKTVVVMENQRKSTIRTYPCAMEEGQCSTKIGNLNAVVSVTAVRFTL